MVNETPRLNRFVIIFLNWVAIPGGRAGSVWAILCLQYETPQLSPSLASCPRPRPPSYILRRRRWSNYLINPFISGRRGGGSADPFFVLFTSRYFVDCIGGSGGSEWAGDTHNLSPQSISDHIGSGTHYIHLSTHPASPKLISRSRGWPALQLSPPVSGLRGNRIFSSCLRLAL